jgi:hypothetical protein
MQSKQARLVVKLVKIASVAKLADRMGQQAMAGDTRRVLHVVTSVWIKHYPLSKAVADLALQVAPRRVLAWLKLDSGSSELKATIAGLAVLPVSDEVVGEMLSIIRTDPAARAALRVARARTRSGSAVSRNRVL